MSLSSPHWASLSWPLSRCFGTWLHKYEIRKEWPDCVLEICERCHHAMYFKIDHRGIANNKTNLHYIKYHIRLLLPKNHPLFKHEYQK